MNPERRCLALVEAIGLGPPHGVEDVQPLSGGVASDIFAFRLEGRVYCAKFALEKLRVAADWHAPVSRNGAEYAWLDFCAGVSPQNSVLLFGHSAKLGGFVMEYLAGETVFNWKQALLECTVIPEGAASVAAALGRIQAASCKVGFDRSPFDNRNEFHALRIEPYLLHATGSNPDLAERLRAIAGRLFQADQALVHGDVSPKNILFRDGSPILLDAECATMGDPAFDPAFCLNHLLLKAIHLPQKRVALLREAHRFHAAYLDTVDWEPKLAVSARILELLPALMLARVDGKSPVEYLGEAERMHVRQLARAHLATAPETLEKLIDSIAGGGEFHG